MPAVDVRRAPRDGRTVEESTARGWRLSARTVAWYGADDAGGGEYAFHLAPARRFRWVPGSSLPLPPGRNPARILTGQHLREFPDTEPRRAPVTGQHRAAKEPTAAWPARPIPSTPS